MKRIAVLNAGSDCPGLNAAIRTIVRKALEEDMEVLGVRDGFFGLVNDKIFVMTKEHVSGILHLGGTILGTSKFDPTENEEDLSRLKKNFEKYQITSLIVLSGHTGTSIAMKLIDEGIPSVIVPATIDNDLIWTDMSIGFATVINTVAYVLDSLHSTASAGHRVLIVEAGGSETGWISVIGGLTGGADYIITEEVEFKPEDLVENIKRRYAGGKRFSIIVVREGTKLPLEDRYYTNGYEPSDVLEMYLKENLSEDVEIKTIKLGYLQRGGKPCALDRLIATIMASHAVELIKKGKVNMAVGMKGFELIETPLTQELLKPRKVPHNLYELAKLFF